MSSSRSPVAEDAVLILWQAKTYAVENGDPSRNELRWLERAVLHKHGRDIWLRYREQMLRKKSKVDSTIVQEALSTGIQDPSMYDAVVNRGLVSCYTEACDSCRQMFLGLVLYLVHEPCALRRLSDDVAEAWAHEEDPRDADETPRGSHAEGDRCALCGRDAGEIHVVKRKCTHQATQP